MNILAIESSCDDTSAAVLTVNGIRSNVIASQSIHIKFGGVVPELASRAHQKTISQTVAQALEEAGISLQEIDLIAVTQGPGLMGSLLVGLCFAKGLALANNIPIVGVNHMDAHIYANFIDNTPEFPFISLTVSGGHTQLVHVKAPFDHEILGKTRDDAAGEAFDKIGKVFGLEYPAGPMMDKLSKEGNPKFHKFPQALLREGLDFSFSGLKTSALYFVQDQEEGFIEENLNDLCASVSEAITEVLVKKLKRAVEQTGVKTIALAGGVSANSMLRSKTEALAEKMGLTLHIPKITYCTDNAAMIAITGKMKADLGEFDGVDIKPFASL
ncbi:MAG: tRNA (adenosine(37)-N6)-threonylcarbamoyltransferase complex transferase subunit TsaD [Balneola sp.]